MKISTKLPLFFVVMICAIIILVSYVGYHITSRALERSVLVGLHTSAGIAAKRFHSFLGHMKRQIGRASQDRVLRANIRDLKSRKKKVRELAKSKLHEHFRGLFQVTRSNLLIDSMEGRPLYAFQKIAASKELETFRGQVFQEWQGKVLFSRPFAKGGTNSHERLMLGAKWLFSPSGKSEGLLLLAFEIPVHLLHGIHFGQTGRVKFGGWITKQRPSSLHGQAQGVFRASDDHGIYIGVWHRVGWPGLWVEARIALREAMAPVIWLRWVICIGTLLILLAALLIVMSFSKTITVPIHRLSSVAHQIAEGHLELRAPVDSDDEIGELAKQFNLMADHVVAEKRRFENLLGSASDAILSIDEAQNIVLFNNQAEVIFGYRKEEVIGQPLSLLLPETVHQIHPSYVKSFASGKPERSLMHQREGLGGLRRDGSLFPIGVSISKLKWEGKWICTAIIRDITKQKMAERVIQEAHEELERRVQERTLDLRTANEELRGFTYIVSHDLRAPLINIKGFSGELQLSIDELQDIFQRVESLLTPEQQTALVRLLKDDIPECLDFINSSSHRMESLIEAILSLSRVGYRKLKFDILSLEDALNDVIRSMNHQMEQKNASVSWSALSKVCADHVSLTQMMANLIGNAVKYARPDVACVIIISTEVRTHETQISIRDNGRGILEEDLPKVFELFRRIGPQKEPGEGMGLNFVRALVRRHGGKIWCESKIGEGTTFHLTLHNNPPEEGSLSGSFSTAEVLETND